MEKYILNEIDYKLIELLLNICLDIKTYYDRLTELEYTNQEDSNEYALIIDNLNKRVIEEKAIYESIGNDTNRLQAIMEYFITKDKINNFNEDLIILISGMTDDIVKRRIIINLLTKKINLEKDKLYQMGLDLDKELKDKGIATLKKKNYAYFGLSNLLVLSDSLKQDFIRTLLTLIKRELKNNPEHEIYKIKYMMIYLYTFLENDLLMEKEEEKLYWSSKFVVDLKNISDEAYCEAREVYGYDIATNACKQANNLLWQLVLRVSLLFCNIEEIANIKKQYPNSIESVLDEFEKDKGIPLIISLKQ